MSSGTKSDLRDQIARALHQQATDDGEVHVLWGGVAEHEEEVAEWLPFADAVLAVLDLDQIKAEAWDSAYAEVLTIPHWWNTEGQEGGFDFGPEDGTETGAFMAVKEALQANPYRKEKSSEL